MAHRERLRGDGETDGDEDESALFRQAVADARRLAADVHVPAISYRAPVPLSDHEREVLRELDALVSGEAPFDLVEGDEYHEGRASGVDPRVVRRLHRGEFSIQAELDLHGVDARSAHELVDRLCSGAHARGLRVVKIVHGRGRNSPGGEAVLRPSLPRWLTRGATGKLVLAWSTAPQNDGGAGATYVLLRREQVREARAQRGRLARAEAARRQPSRPGRHRRSPGDPVS